jgi:hypothetical protein
MGEPATRFRRDLAAALGVGLLAYFLTGLAVHDDLVVFQLGPNDHRYLEGFAPHYEVENGAVGTRWTTYHARIDLPLVLEGPAEVSYRFSRVFGETAEAEVRLGESTIDRFTARGGAAPARFMVDADLLTIVERDAAVRPGGDRDDLAHLCHHRALLRLP